jgi:hypothetical protein
MLKAVKTKGSNPPIKSPMMTFGSLSENANLKLPPLAVRWARYSST